MAKSRHRSCRIDFQNRAASLATGQSGYHFDGGNPGNIKGMTSCRLGESAYPVTARFARITFHQGTAIEKVDGH